MAKVGDILGGRYRLDSILGRGGMAVVYAATHLDLQQRVAVKIPSADLLEDTTVRARFLREARSAARIRSAHVAQVLDVATEEDGSTYLVMELLPGADLSLTLEREGPLSLDQAADIALQIAEALAAAHRLGIVHRDLKPSNVFLATMLDGSRCAKVLDFGIAKVPRAHEEETTLTSTTAVMGSPAYMSPEQMLTPREVDPRADVWAFGVVLHRMLTGKLPWPAGTPLETAARIMSEPAPAPSSIRPELPKEIDAVVARCLEKDRKARFADVAEVASALADVVPSLRARAERVARILKTPAPPEETTPARRDELATIAAKGSTPHDVPTEIEPKTDGASVSDPRVPKKSRWPIVVAAAALAVLTTVIVFANRSPRSPVPPTSATEHPATPSFGSSAVASGSQGGPLGSSAGANSAKETASTPSATAKDPQAPSASPSASAKGPFSPVGKTVSSAAGSTSAGKKGEDDNPWGPPW